MEYGLAERSGIMSFAINFTHICIIFVKIHIDKNINIEIMALEQQIQKDIMAAMKAHEQIRLDALRAVKSAILLAKTAGANIELSDADIIKIMQKQVKQRKESAQMYSDAGRNDLAENELAQASYIEAYLPKQLSEQELEDKIKEIIGEVGATSCAQMGAVMGVATKRLAGLADGKAISMGVKRLLS